MDVGTRYQAVSLILRPPVLDGLLGGIEELLSQGVVLIPCHYRSSLRWMPVQAAPKA